MVKLEVVYLKQWIKVLCNWYLVSVNQIGEMPHSLLFPVGNDYQGESCIWGPNASLNFKHFKTMG